MFKPHPYAKYSRELTPFDLGKKITRTKISHYNLSGYSVLFDHHLVKFQIYPEVKMTVDTDYALRYDVKPYYNDDNWVVSDEVEKPMNEKEKEEYYDYIWELFKIKEMHFGRETPEEEIFTIMSIFVCGKFDRQLEKL